MSETLSFIREQDARGSTARVFDDIRATLGNGAVNLIWRHLATVPGALEPIWGAVRPIHQAGRAGPAARALSRAVADPVPPWSTLPEGCDRAATLATVLSYNRGNAFNLVTLGALLADPGVEAVGTGRYAADSADGHPFEATTPGDWPAPALPPTAVVPPIPELADLAVPLRDSVLVLNAFGAPASAEGIVATLYKHLAAWPGVLAPVEAELRAMSTSGELTTRIERAARFAARQSAALAVDRGRLADTSAVATGLVAVRRFVDGVIVRMLPIGARLAARLAPCEGGH